MSSHAEGNPDPASHDPSDLAMERFRTLTTRVATWCAILVAGVAVAIGVMATVLVRRDPDGLHDLWYLFMFAYLIAAAFLGGFTYLAHRLRHRFPTGSLVLMSVTSGVGLLTVFGIASFLVPG